MDGECVLLLPRVCEVLADPGRSLPDDTSLEKLLDYLTGLTQAGGSLLQSCPALLDFISTVTHDRAADPGVLSFALKLTGFMAATEGDFKTLQEFQILDVLFSPQHWEEAGLWGDPCVRIGWIQGLDRMLRHPEALAFFQKSDFIKHLLHLQTDTSLFVASASNRTLAHILLFLQPDLPPCSPTDGKDDSAGRTNGSVAPPQPAAAFDVNNPVVMAISGHLKESLVPKDPAQHHRSLQTLKLLVPVLGRAGPALREMLLRVVSDPLEELVVGGHGRLTLAVMDVVMATQSSVLDQGAGPRTLGRLLSLMLKVGGPADLVQVASALLHRNPRDAADAAQAVRILLLVLDVVTGQHLLASGPAADELRAAMAEQLRSKTSCVSLTCICLRATPQITLMPPEVLPCPPASVARAVVSLLRLCTGRSSAGSTDQISRNVVSSGKVEKCALEALTSLSGGPGVKDLVQEVLTLLLEYLDHPDSDATVLHKSYKALMTWMSECSDVSSITEGFGEDLLRLVRKRVCDPRWEVRDSTVEFLGHLARDAPAAAAAAMAPSDTTSLLREALQDQESYVRASAVAALARTLARRRQQGAPPPQEQSEVISSLLEMLSEDTEGFARRAVVRFFIAWFSSSRPAPSSPLLADAVPAVLLRGSVDLDWEVKVHTLELAELLLDEALSGCRGDKRRSGGDLDGVLNSLVQQGVLSALLGGLVDCDRPVALKACQLLMTLRDAACSASVSVTTTVSCELPGRGWGREIRKMLSANGASEVVRELTEEEGGGEGVCVSVCEALRFLELDRRLAVLTQSSDHVHNSLRSLLQDILSAGGAQLDARPGQEVIVDCY